MHRTTQPKTVTLRAPSKYWFVLTVGPWGVAFHHPILDLTHNIHPRSWSANFPVSSSFHTFPIASGLPKSSIFHPTVFRSSPESSILHLPRHIIDSIIPSFHFPWRHHLFSFRPPAASRATSPRGAAHRQRRRNGRRGQRWMPVAPEAGADAATVVTVEVGRPARWLRPGRGASCMSWRWWTRDFLVPKCAKMGVSSKRKWMFIQNYRL